MPMSTRVVVADDHQLVRAGIASLLSEIPGVEVVGEACDGSEALRMACELKPDILFLDLAMPGMSGFEALALINEADPDVRVVILSMHGSEEHVLRALKLGAVGFMLKNSAPEELALTISAVNREDTWLSPAISKAVISRYLERSGAEDRQSALTVRQNQVLKMIAEGCGTREVSVALKLSVKTIETYRSQIMDRLQIRDLPGLVRYAIRQGIIPL